LIRVEIALKEDNPRYTAISRRAQKGGATQEPAIFLAERRSAKSLMVLANPLGNGKNLFTDPHSIQAYLRIS